MIVKTAELEGAALDWAVAKIEGIYLMPAMYYVTKNVCPLTGEWEEDIWSPSTDWAQGGPLIDNYRPVLFPAGDSGFVGYINQNPKCSYVDTSADVEGIHDTYLIAAMRAIVASELGNEVDVPEELTHTP